MGRQTGKFKVDDDNDEYCYLSLILRIEGFLKKGEWKDF